MEKSNKKIKKTIWLTPQTLGLVQGYSKAVEEDFSNSVETLIIKGLENINTANDLKKIVYDELKKVRLDIKKSTDRTSNLAIGNARIAGKIYGHTKAIIDSEYKIDNEELAEYEGYGIKKAVQDLKWKSEV